MVTNLPAKVGDTGSLPGPGRSTRQGATKPTPQLLSPDPGNRAHKPQACALCPRACAPQQGKPPRGKPVHHSHGVAPLTATGEKPTEQRRPSTAKTK